MTEVGKAMIKSKLPLPGPRGGTDFWVGILKTLELAKNQYRPGALTVIFLLTDGATDVSRIPAGGFKAAIEDWKEDNPSIEFMINTIGFGYGAGVDMRTLSEIAHATGGTVSYIPDGGLVCPVFTHLVANLSSCQHVNLNLRLEPADGVRLSKTNFPIKMLQSGQSRDFYVEMRGSLSSFKAVLDDVTTEFGELPVEERDGLFLRNCLVNQLEKSVTTRAFDLAEFIAISGQVADDDMKKAVLEDVEHSDLYKGQIEKAFRPTNWTNWGYHYILSILDGHRLQIRVNDKDAIGAQYGVGSLTETLIKKGTRLLRTLTLPEGKFSANRQAVAASLYNYTGPRAVTLAAGGGCFLGEGLVLMDDGSRKRVDLLRKGDVVDGGFRIVCVVTTKMAEGTEIVRLGSGGWTPNHPVRFNGTWYLPGDMVPEKHENCEAVYNFVLDAGHILTIGSVETCTIGHDFVGPVIEHPFYGARVAGVPHMLDLLEADPRYEAGYVVLTNVEVKRDELGYVCGFS